MQLYNKQIQRLSKLGHDVYPINDIFILSLKIAKKDYTYLLFDWFD